jgi:hypothetical protein
MGVGRSHRTSERADEECPGCHAFQLDLDGARQPVLKWNSRGRRLRKSQFYANVAVSRFAGHAVHSRLEMTVLSPGEPVKAESSGLAGTEAPQRGREKLGNDPDMPRGDDRRQTFALTDHRAYLQRSDLRQPTVHGRADMALLDLTFSPRHG